MAARPGLQTQNLPGITVAEANATSSPARGRAMVETLSQKFRLPLQHTWVFWHDRQEPKSRSSTAKPEGNYAERLTQLHAISDVRQFWEVFNNFDVATLPMRDSVHLFKSGVKPLWEDPRNERGGAWTFRVPKDKVREFWQEVCMMAVGEKLQDAVATNRLSKFLFQDL
jgi:Eukaryotic initiation factor 4E